MEPRQEKFSVKIHHFWLLNSKISPVETSTVTFVILEESGDHIDFSFLQHCAPSKHQQTFPAQSSSVHPTGFSRLQLVYSGNITVALDTVAVGSMKVSCPWHLENFWGRFFTP